MRIVMISGKQGSGKSTLAGNLVKQITKRLGAPAERHRFADPLYELHDLVLERAKQWGLVPADREKDGRLLQVLGTEWGRETLGPDVWVWALRLRLNARGRDLIRSPSPPYFIVDDCRFPNEFAAFPGALRIRLEACESVRRRRALSWRPDTKHLSETGLDGETAFDCVIDTGSAGEEETIEEAWRAIEDFRWSPQ